MTFTARRIRWAPDRILIWAEFALQVDEEICLEAEERPSSVLECGPTECEGGGWQAGPWSVCSVSCGGYGVQTRPVSCRPGSRCEGERPLTSRHCRGPCSHHQGSGWTRLEDGPAREQPPDIQEEEEIEEMEEMEERKENVTESGRGRAEFLETSGQLALSPYGKSLLIKFCALILHLWVSPDKHWTFTTLCICFTNILPNKENIVH